MTQPPSSGLGRAESLQKQRPSLELLFVQEKTADISFTFISLERCCLTPPGSRRSQQDQRKETRKIISSMSLSDDVQFSKAEKAWKPTAKMSTRSSGAEEDEDDDPEQVKTQELFNHLHSIVNKLTRQTFQELMKQVMDLTIDTEERLKGTVELIFEKAISEPNSSVAYANMCRCLVGLKVPTSDKPGVFVNFRKLLLNRCQKEFEKEQDDDEIFEKKQKEIEAAKEVRNCERLRVELQDSRDQARRRSLGNIKFICELFKLKMLTEAIMHDCVVKLLKKDNEESLECLCMLLSTIGKDLDFEKAKPRMDQYFNQMDQIIKERKISSRISLMLQDVLDLRKSNWLQDEGWNMWGRGSHTPGRRWTSQPQDEGWNTVPISRNRPIDTTRLSKITKPPGPRRSQQGQRKEPWKMISLEQAKTQELFNSLRSILDKLTPQKFQELMKQVMDLTIDTEERLKGAIDLIFEKAISEPNSSVVYANMCRCLMGLKVPTSDKPGVFVNFRKLLLNRCHKEFEKDQDDDDIIEKKQKEIEAAKEGEERERLRVELQESRDQAQRRSLGNIKFMGELFKLKMLTEAIMHDCIVKLLKNRNEESLECLCMLLSTIGKNLYIEKAKPRMDQYFNQMGKIIREKKTSSKIRLMLQDVLDLRGTKNTTLTEQQEDDKKSEYRPVNKFCQGMGEQDDVGGCGCVLDKIIHRDYESHNNWVPHRGDQGPITREDQGPETIEQIHKGAECPQVAEDEDDNKFVTEQKVEFTTGEETESKEVDEKKVLTGEELSKQLDRLIQDKANNEHIRDWAEANLDEQQTASNQFVRALMTSLCQSAIIGDNPYRVDARQIGQRARLLHRYLSDEQKELQALYALQALMVHMEQPANLLRMFFDVLYDEDVIKEEAFHEWEASKDPAEQKGKGVAKRSVTAFFTWLREAEEDEESD
ncbi:eukaryotic translation initiation factor 4 gamma 1-like [Sebastes fasciatus]|uniref:eukaryotic translation initiation factor 4 gamma 1-like n=1 Tax=Sebastes fasciatus TaxID=394691 RepID=UPI003D9DB97B